LVSLVCGLLAAVLVWVVLQERGASTAVAVADRDVASGVALTPGAVRWVEVPGGSPLAGELVDREALESGEWFTARPYREGEPFTRDGLTRDSGGERARAMSVPVSPEHAAGGDLGPGDRVDVIDTTAEGSRYVVVGAEVLAVAGRDAGGLAASSTQFHVTVAVDAAEALALAAAMADGSVEVVRSTGASPPEVRDALEADTAATTTTR
jgi:Flp pilus assembly protein CpaB